MRYMTSHIFKKANASSHCSKVDTASSKATPEIKAAQRHTLRTLARQAASTLRKRTKCRVLSMPALPEEICVITTLPSSLNGICSVLLAFRCSNAFSAKMHGVERHCRYAEAHTERWQGASAGFETMAETTPAIAPAKAEMPSDAELSGKNAKRAPVHVRRRYIQSALQTQPLSCTRDARSNTKNLPAASAGSQYSIQSAL